MSYNQLPTRTKRELQNAVTHIAYEVEALRRAAAGKGPGSWLTEFFWTPSTSHGMPQRDFDDGQLLSQSALFSAA